MIPDATQYRTHGANDALVVKFDSSGVYQWSSQIGMTEADTEGSAIAVGKVSGVAAVITGSSDGYLNGTQVGTHGSRDLILLRTDSSGALP